MKIDVHAHGIPPECFSMVDKTGRNIAPVIDAYATPEVITVSDKLRGETVLRNEPKRIIEDMDKIGLDMRALSMVPPTLFYSVDPDDGLKFSQKQNNAFAEWVRAYPDRFIGIATLPMQDISKAVPEMERAVRGLGLKAVVIRSNINGKNLDEKEFWPFYQKAQELDVPIYVHPFGNLNAGADRMQKYFLQNLVGNPLDTTLAIACIIFGGVLESFPRLRFMFSHAGGYLPFIRGRWEQGYRVIQACQTIPKPPSEYIKMMYFDTVTHFDPALDYLVNTIGADKVVLGSDYPASMGIADCVSQVRNAAGISAKDKETILERSSLAWLKL